MIYHFILNPKSGKRKKSPSYENAIKAACKARQLIYHIYYTTRPGDATSYVRSMINISSDRQRFICIGGDGTINEIVNSAPENPNVEFGVIPSGSGNDFARNFTKPELFQSIDAQIDGEAVALDLIRCNDMYCVNMVNIGFDCSVVKAASRLKKTGLISPGMSYIGGVAVTFFKKFGTPMKLIFDNGETIDGKLMLTAIGNGQFCGGGFNTAPRALLTDGLMDVCMIRKLSRFSFIRLVKSYKAGTFLTNTHAMKYMQYRRIPHFRMEFESPISICIDGEIAEAQTIDFSVIKNGFRFVIPKGAEMKFKDPASLPLTI